MALHLRPIRKERIKKYLQDTMPQALKGTPWEVESGPEN